jgi:hypothetical protein
MATATYIPIATQTLGSAAASITFSSIPGTYTDLRLVIVNLASSVDESLTFNGDTGTNYSLTALAGSGVPAASSNNLTSYSKIVSDLIGGAGSSPHMATFDIFSYAGSTNKSVLVSAAMDSNGTGYVELTIGLWRSTAAITSLTLTSGGGNFATGTIATLWGI